ncbi:MAG: hypothetical protein QOG00_644 [Pyrinomonadaceae bacterium]|nr:hypothetical protein [Pyrinomonadaceae bacterium]
MRPCLDSCADTPIRFYPPQTIDLWVGYSKRYLAQAASPPEQRAKYVAVRNKLIKAIHDAGGKILAGSDTPSTKNINDKKH